LKEDISWETGIHGWIILKLILKEYGATMWTGFMYLRIEASGGLLSIL
jgi:hypothetical protein